MIETHNLVSLEGPSLENAIRKDFGLEVKNLEKMTKGHANQVYKGTLEGRVVFIRINKNPKKFEVELAGYQIFKDQEIPIPEVIAYIANPTSIGQPTMIMKSAEGTALSESEMSHEQEESIYTNLGQVLKKINSVQLEGFGPVDIKDGKMSGRFTNYQEYCGYLEKSLNDALGYLASNNLITNDEAEKLHKIFGEIKSEELNTGFLLHRDIYPEHVFVNDNKVTGIIDLGRIEVGDPRHDIAKSLITMTPEQQEYFKKGYGGLAFDPMVHKYLTIRATTIACFITKIRTKEESEKAIRFLKGLLST